MHKRIGPSIPFLMKLVFAIMTFCAVTVLLGPLLTQHPSLALIIVFSACTFGACCIPEK